MKRNEYQVEITKSARIHSPDKGLFLDIETTGLKKETSFLTALAIGFFEEEWFHIIQWVNDDAISEEEMLLELKEYLSKASVLITFNGDSFDLPFLKMHFEYNDLDNKIFHGIPSLDLYGFLRPFSYLFSLEKSNQKAWETYLGISRVDQLQGKDLVKLYKKFLKEKNDDYLQPLMLHNFEDVRGLAQMMKLMPLRQFQQGRFRIFGMQEGECESDMIIQFVIELDEKMEDLITIHGRKGSLEMKNERMAVISIPYVEGKMYHYYPDYKNYYYLPLEDRAIHKSIGTFVDRAHREKATAKNCYISLESIFLPVPDSQNRYGFVVNYQDNTSLSLYQANFESKTWYLHLEDLIEDDRLGEEAIDYLKNMIQAIFLEKITGKNE